MENMFGFLIEGWGVGGVMFLILFGEWGRGGEMEEVLEGVLEVFLWLLGWGREGLMNVIWVCVFV